MGTAVRLALGLLWWWAALRLALGSRSPGVLEAGVVLGGWSVSLLPVHCVAKDRATGAVVTTGRFVRALRGRREGDQAADQVLDPATDPAAERGPTEEGRGRGAEDG